MTLTETKRWPVIILKVQGRLDATSGPEVARGLTASIDGGARQLVLDLFGLEYLSSAGLRVFLAAARQMQRVGGKLALAAVTRPVWEILHMAQFSAIIPLFETLDQACASFASPVTQTRPDPCLLSFAEEIYLLALDDQKGVLKPLPIGSLAHALAGAVLMELALDGRIDTDLTTLTVTSTAPTGDALLDETLTELQAECAPKPVSFWLQKLVRESKRLVARVQADLIRKNILKEENQRLLWVFAVRRYPMIDQREVKEVRTRLREMILSDTVPAPRDVVLLSLAHACRLLDDLFTPEEYAQAQSRIATLTSLDLIGRAVFHAIRQIERVLENSSSMQIT